jgi:GT2 family glycosyltransferase
VRYTQPKPAPLVSIIIPTRNAEQLVRVCTASIFARTAYKNYEIILVDNRSDDASALAFFEELEASGIQVLQYDAEFNYSAITNFAVKEAKGEILCLLNNDIEILEPSWLDELVAQAIRPEIGAVGTKLYYPDMTLQHAGVITGLGGVAGHAFKGFGKQNPGTPQFRPHLVHNVSAVTAACLVIRKSIFNKGFNEKELSVAFNDVDFCLKVQTLGYRNLYTPFAELIHHESASRGHENTPEKVRRFQKEIEAITQAWGDSLLEDPAYNPNLSLDSEDFALAYPPRLKPLNDELTQFIKLNV